jgi:hypothetical protein
MRAETKNGRRYADSLNAEAGWALRRCASQQQQIAQALDLSASWVSRMCNGAESGSVQRFLQHVQRLMEGGHTTPGPVIAQVLVACTKATRPYAAAELRALLYRTWDEETRWQGLCDQATYRLIRADEDVRRDDACPDDFRRLSEAQDAFDEAARMHAGWLVVAMVLVDEMRRRTDGEEG